MGAVTLAHWGEGGRRERGLPAALRHWKVAHTIRDSIVLGNTAGVEASDWGLAWLILILRMIRPRMAVGCRSRF